MFYVINVTDGCPSSFKAEVYSADKFSLEEVLTIFKNYCEQRDENGVLFTTDGEFSYTFRIFDCMNEIEEVTEGYYYEM